MASYKDESRSADGIPTLDELQPGKPLVLSCLLSASARTQLRVRIEVIESSCIENESSAIKVGTVSPLL